MSSKDTKALLKTVREAIKDEKYKEAIKICEEVLKIERNSYMGLLLMGAAYQNINKQEAAKYLRQALEYCSPQPPTVALQGLSNCAPNDELPKIYEQLIELLPEKQSYYIEKLFNISSDVKTVQECFNIFKRLVLNAKDEEGKTVLLKYLGRIWIQHDLSVEPDDVQLYKSSLESIISDESAKICLPAYKRFIKLLYNLTDLNFCLERACNLVDYYPDDVYAYEWICKIYCEHYNSPKKSCLDSLKNTIDFYATKLLELNENSSLALFVKAINLSNEKQFVAAKEYLCKVQIVQPDYEEAIKLLALTEMHLEAYALAELRWYQLKEHSITEFAICLSYSEEKHKLEEATRILKTKDSTEEIKRALARCYYKLEDYESLHGLELDPLSRAEFLMSPAEAIGYIDTHLKEDLESFPVLFLMGKCYYKVQNYNNALKSILKATRLKPYSSECFYYLGKIYFATNDITRSRKCFEKCVTLNSLNEKAVENLSIIYQQLEEEDLNASLLVNTLKYLKNSERSKHIHYKLGLHYLSVQKSDEAIQSFRSAIKGDVTCMVYWESLGDAYAERGSYNSAIRVFQKILEMQPENLYAKLQIGVIKTIIRMFSEAIKDFDNLLKDNENYLPALKGATEAHIGIANNLKLEYRFGRARDHLQIAANMLQRCFLNPEHLNMVWVWCLAAKVFVMTAQMPEPLAYLDVSGKLAKRDTDIACLTRKDLISLALRFYTCALKIKQNTYMWYELALCSYHAAEYISKDAKSHLDVAAKACQMALKEQSTRWHNWNLLGVINMHPVLDNLPLAQHCFIQALNIDRKSYTTWTNLGVLYLKLQEIKLANQAFQRAQQASPIYPNAWIGQAMIAEAINEEIEAIDLYRHCQQFEYHPESSLGYAHWTCQILSDKKKYELPHYKYAIESMYADIVALDAINRYNVVEGNKSSISAYSFQGFLSERQKLYETAVRAYTKAVETADDGEELDLIYTNLGYAYMKLNKPNDAINAFNRVAKASFKPIIGLALAYFKAGQHEESYSVYSSVLKSVAGIDDGKAARILVAMSSMVYAFQGEADTKTLLYQCILLKDSPIQALYSACALGILHQDNQLSETILIELKKYENCEKYITDIAFLTAQYYKANQQPRKALTYLMTRVHIFPQCAELRKVLANFLLDNYNHKQQYYNAISQVALSSIILMHGSKTRKSNFIEDSNTLLLASKALQLLDKQRCLKLIQRAVLLNPSNSNAWNALLKVE